MSHLKILRERSTEIMTLTPPALRYELMNCDATQRAYQLHMMRECLVMAALNCSDNDLLKIARDLAILKS